MPTYACRHAHRPEDVGDPPVDAEDLLVVPILVGVAMALYGEHLLERAQRAVRPVEK